MPDSIYKNLWETITAGFEWKGELQNKRKDGSLFWESISISPIRNEFGLITHFIAIKEDISDRIRMESELRENERIQRTLIESLPRITSYNVCYTKLLRPKHESAEDSSLRSERSEPPACAA